MLTATVVNVSVSSVNCGLRVQRSSTSERYFLQQIHQWPEKASVEIDRKILADIAVFDKVRSPLWLKKRKQLWHKPVERGASLPLFVSTPSKH